MNSIVGLAVAIIILTSLGYAISALECSAKWRDSGRKYEWSILAGCRVEDGNGKLIPEANIRDIQ